MKCGSITIAYSFLATLCHVIRSIWICYGWMCFSKQYILSSTLSMETPNHKLFGKHPNDICLKKQDCKNFLYLKHQRKNNFQENLSFIMFALI